MSLRTPLATALRAQRIAIPAQIGKSPTLFHQRNIAITRLGTRFSYVAISTGIKPLTHGKKIGKVARFPKFLTFLVGIFNLTLIATPVCSVITSPIRIAIVSKTTSCSPRLESTPFLLIATKGIELSKSAKLKRNVSSVSFGF